MLRTPQFAWNKWAKENPDLFWSVGRDSDIKQLDIGIEDVIKKLFLKKDDKLLDIGCGSGLFLSELVKRTGIKNAVGIDFSGRQIEYAKKNFSNLGIEFKFCNAESMDFPDKSFNKILCYSVMHYIKDQKKVVNNLLRICSDDGIMLIGDMPSSKYKYKMYLEYIKSFPMNLFDLLIRSKGRFNYFGLNYCWSWIDLEALRDYVKSLGFEAEILTPPQHRQFGKITERYRFDLIITKMRDNR